MTSESKPVVSFLGPVASYTHQVSSPHGRISLPAADRMTLTWADLVV